MSEFLSEINYDKLINNNLLGVVRDALKIAADQGLPAENHFYITFKTNFKGVKIPKMLQIQYPENMTIVLQHQFSDLTVSDTKFSVVLVFGGVPYTLIIPFASITYFADPYAKFGLSFEMPDHVSKLEDADVEHTKQTHDTAPAEVISIDNYRKKQ